MSRSQTYQSEDMHDQLTILVGSAIQLLGSDAGVLIIATEAFDPQSNNDYVVYRLGQEGFAKLLQRVQEGLQPTSRHPLVIEIIEPEWVSQILPQDDTAPSRELECC